MNRMPPILRLLALAALAPFLAQGAEPRESPSPELLAAESQVVALAQLERVDYEYRRGFPVDGRAWFRVLLTYKSPEPRDRIIVYEEGLKDVECYFPDLPRAQEQPRYLLFLNRDENNRLRGHPEGCALEVLSTADGRYVLRWPQEHMHLEGDQLDLVQEFEFHGPLSRIDGSDLTRTAREVRAEAEHMRIDGTDLYYTRGILLQDFRPLMAAGLAVEDQRVQRRQREILELLAEDAEDGDKGNEG